MSEKTLTRMDLAEAVYAEVGLTRKAAQQLVDEVFEELSKTLEKGETVTLATLIQVLRVLDKLEVMEAFTVKQSVSPLAVAKAQLGKRKRASGKGTDAKDQSDW
jgi:hypothetical protein